MYQRHRSCVCMRKSDGAISISFSLSLFFRSMLRRGSSLNDLSLRPLPSFGSLFWFHSHAGARIFLLSILFPYLPLLGSDLLCYWSETPVFFLLFCSSLRIIFFRRSSHPLYLATSALRSFLPSLAARLISSLYSTPHHTCFELETARKDFFLDTPDPPSNYPRTASFSSVHSTTSFIHFSKISALAHSLDTHITLHTILFGVY